MRLSPKETDTLLRELAPVIRRCTLTALGVGRDELRSTLPDLDIHAARHTERDARLFIT
jgi:urease accessory protein UreF